jgi:hypothetical protein
VFTEKIVKMDTHKEQINQCKLIFPTWSWLVGIISGSMVVIATCAYVYATQEASQDSRLADHTTRIDRLEVIQRDIDTVKMLLRDRK